MNIGTLIATIGGDIKPLEGALGKANESLNKFADRAAKNVQEVQNQFRGLNTIGQSMQNMGKTMSLALTLPLAGAGIAAGKMAMDWQEGMAKINTTAQMNQSELKKLSNQIFKMGVDAKADLSKVPEAYEKIISQTGDAALSTEIFAASLKGAKAGFTDISVVSGALAQSLSAIGKGGADAQQVIDTLFAAKRVGAGEFADFANYIPSLIASAKGVGISWQEVAGSFAYMTGKGNDAASSTMLLQNAFNALGKGKIQEGLKNAGISVFDLNGKMRGLTDIFTEVGAKMASMNDEEKTAWLESIDLKDQQAKQAFMVLSSETNKLGEAMLATKNSSGELDKALKFSISPATTAAQAMSNLKAVAIGFGNVMLPIFNKLMGAASSVLGWLAGLDDGTKKWVIAIGALLASIGPLLFGIGKFITLLPTLKTGLIAIKTVMKTLGTPFGLWGIAIAAAITGITLLWKHCDTFRAVVKYVAQSVLAYFQKAWIEIKMGAELMWVAIKTYFTAIPKLATAVWNIVKRVMKGENIGDVIKDEFTNAFADAGNEVKGITEKYNKQLAQIEAPSFKDILASEKAKGDAKEAGSEIGNAVQTGMEDVLNVPSTPASATTPSGGNKSGGIKVLEDQLAELEKKIGTLGSEKLEIANLLHIEDLKKEIEKAWKKIEEKMGKAKIKIMPELKVDDYSAVDELEKEIEESFESIKIPPLKGSQVLDMSLLSVANNMDVLKKKAETFGEPYDDLSVTLESLKTELDKLTAEKLPENAEAIRILGEQYRATAAQIEQTEARTVDFGSMLTTLATDSLSTFAEGLGGMFAGTANAGDLFKNLIKVVLDFCSTLGKALIAAGIGAISFKKLLDSPGLAIAAGVALVALSSAVSGLLDKGASGGGGKVLSESGTELPGYANGALSIAPHAAIVGDNPNARFDPELTMPMSKLNQFLDTGEGSGGTGIPAVIRLIASGEDLEAVINTRQRRNNNMR